MQSGRFPYKFVIGGIEKKRKKKENRHDAYFAVLPNSTTKGLSLLSRDGLNPLGSLQYVAASGAKKVAQSYLLSVSNGFAQRPRP